MVKSYKTKDSGKRIKYASDMRRDLADGKPRFDFINPLDMPYNETLLYRWAMLAERGREKYGPRNWEKANSIEEFERFKASSWRHFVQAMSGEDDEDHIAAAVWNLNAATYIMWKLKIDMNGNKINKGENNE